MIGESNHILSKIGKARDDTVSAVMEVYALNQSLLRTSSLPEPIALEDSEGSIELATTFNDDTLPRILLT